MDYDPATRVTAGELRAMGINIDPRVPDCGHTNRAPRLVSCTHVPSDCNVLTMDLSLQYDAFHWITVDLLITKGQT